MYLIFQNLIIPLYKKWTHVCVWEKLLFWLIKKYFKILLIYKC